MPPLGLFSNPCEFYVPCTIKYMICCNVCRCHQCQGTFHSLDHECHCMHQLCHQPYACDLRRSRHCPPNPGHGPLLRSFHARRFLLEPNPASLVRCSSLESSPTPSQHCLVFFRQQLRLDSNHGLFGYQNGPSMSGVLFVEASENEWAQELE